MSDEIELTPDSELHESEAVNDMFENWFLDYASYVILDRAVPHINDGLKPVQRRILHSMRELDDGRFNKIANVIGNTMKYHPHGDASIGDATVQLGQKELLVDTQGNWGDPVTGDSAAAPRYIEGRLSKFAQDVAFNPKTTEWKLSYDGRNREPITLPMKFPLLLAQGVEGIAVGLSTKVLPHNFNELIKASIDYLRGRKINLLPDFPTGGIADVSKYNEGQRGGKVRVRARIEERDSKTLVITEIPFGTTTVSLMESIVNANDKGKIRIRKVEDLTSQNVEVVIHLASGVSPDKTIDALYAFTDCEYGLSPNSCVIFEDKPRFMSVNDILKFNTDQTVLLLKMELEIALKELNEKLFYASLEKIFIENRIYRKIEVAETFEEVITIIDKGLKPFVQNLYRDVTREDILKLTEIRIKRISKYDSFQADEAMKKLEKDIKQVKYNLKNLIEYTIEYFTEIQKKYGKGKERKTELREFETVQVNAVVAKNAKLYFNAKDGFAGMSLKNDTLIAECSDIDDVIVFNEDGSMKVFKISDKTFVGKDVLHIAIFKKGDERTIYNMIYRDGDKGATYMKRFSVTGITRDKQYDLTRGNKGSKVFYFTANPNGEAETIEVQLKPKVGLRKDRFEINFAELEIKGRGVQGNLVTKYDVKSVKMKKRGVSTLGGEKRWFDTNTKRLNKEERGIYLGEFLANDRIIAVYKSGNFELTNFELTNHYREDITIIKKFRPNTVLSAAYYDVDKENYYLKRFVIDKSTEDKLFGFIGENEKNVLLNVCLFDDAHCKVEFKKPKKGLLAPPMEFDLSEFVELANPKAVGKKITSDDVKEIRFISLDPEDGLDEVETKPVFKTTLF
jgi:topoisomerase-4 subunit A